MNKTQKALTISLWALMVTAAVAMIASGMWSRTRGPASGEPPQAAGLSGERLDIPVPAFAVVDQESRPFTLDSLKGRPWIADFIFTRCAGPCPLMTAKMAQLQKKLSGAEVKLVSFTVDPENDTPAVLKEYGRKFDADSKSWTFATGQPAAMYDLARAMNIGITPAKKAEPIVHSTYFVLVDRDGHIRKYYGGQGGDLSDLVADARMLAGVR